MYIKVKSNVIVGAVCTAIKVYDDYGFVSSNNKWTVL